eukprot:6200105-Pleurochrysis_carterae.AAC.1
MLSTWSAARDHARPNGLYEPPEPPAPDTSKKLKKSQKEPPNDQESNVLLNCDCVPYKRGGRYRERKTTAAGAQERGLLARGLARRQRQQLYPTRPAQSVRSENHDLKGEKIAAELQLKSNSQREVELRIYSLKARVAAEYQEKLHSQHMQGLATGSSMASQGAMQVPGVQPFSFAAARSASIGSGPGNGLWHVGA